VRWFRWETLLLLEDFYKVRFQVDDAVDRSVMYVHGGSMLGGNSAFAHYGKRSLRLTAVLKLMRRA
jgi:hypothetical protein